MTRYDVRFQLRLSVLIYHDGENNKLIHEIKQLLKFLSYIFLYKANLELLIIRELIKTAYVREPDYEAYSVRLRNIRLVF